MDKGLPLSMFLGLAVIAAALVSRTSTTQESPTLVTPQKENTDSTVAQVSLPQGFDKGEELLEAFFGDCPGQSGTRCRGPADFDVVIAGLPDPYDSRMDWIYDALLASTQRAFETSGFVLDRYWLPEPADSVYAPIAGNRVFVPERRVHPGVVLFRHWDPEQPDSVGLRLLYLVGEVPTGGVHALALESALEERARLFADPPFTPPDRAEMRADTVRILGPVFSGSSYSYRRVLDRWLSGRDDDMPSVKMVSGSATNPGNKPTLEGSESQINFHATVNSDAVLLSALGPMVLEPLGIEPAQVAILQESSTAYGRGFAAPTRGGDQRFLTIPFPMSISLLRTEYAQLPALDEPLDLLPRTTEGPRVPLSLAERARSSETPPSVSGLTAPTLDIVLEEITRTLKLEKIRAVGLMATDVRDKLFLGDQVKRRLPHVQLFTLESNVLLRAPRYGSALTGMLVLSTYPLFLENQGRAPGNPDRQRLEFPNDGAEGTYNAAIMLLGKDDAVLDYGPPDSTCIRQSPPWVATRRSIPVNFRRPPVWLTAVGRTAFLPISCWVPKLQSEDEAYVALGSDSLSPPREGAHPRHGLFPWAGFVVVLLAFALAALVAPEREPKDAGGSGATARWRAVDELRGHEASLRMRLAWFRIGLLLGLGGLLAILAPLPTQESGWRPAILFLVLWVVVIAQLLPLLASEGKGTPRPSRLGPAALPVFASVTPLPAGLRVSREARDRAGRLPFLEARGVRLFRMAAALAVVVGGILLVVYAFEIGELRDQAPGSFQLLVQRAVQWGGGVSPLLPLTLGLLGVTAWCGWHWIRLSFLLMVRPFEDSCYISPEAQSPRTSLPAIPEAWLDAWRRAGEQVRKVRSRLSQPLTGQSGLALAILLVAASAWVALPGMPTLESAAFVPATLPFSAWRLLMVGFVAGSIVVTAWAAYRLGTVWAALRRGMAAINETPLSAAFERLPRRIEHLTRITLQREGPRAILGAVAATQWRQLQQLYRLAEDAQEPPEESGQLPSGVAAQVKELMEVEAPGLFQDAGPSITDGWVLARLRSVLTSLWCHEPHQELAQSVEGALSEGSAVYEMSSSREIRSRFKGHEGLWIRAAEECLATQVAGYVGWVLEQLRWLTLFLLLCILMSTVFVSSYPFPTQADAKLLYFFVAGGALITILLTMFQMNRDPLLSRIHGSDPGKVNWDAKFVGRLLLFGAIPLLALLSSAFVPVRTLLMTWVEPLIRTLTTGS